MASQRPWLDRLLAIPAAGEAEPLRRLSSSLTFGIKLFAPLLVVSGAAGWWGIARERHGDPLALGLAILGMLFLVAGLVGTQLLSVAVQGESLIIQGLFREIRVPLTDVETVSGGSVFSNTPISITFLRGSAVGSRVYFLPRLRILPFGRHPTIAFLDTLVEESKSRPVARPD